MAFIMTYDELRGLLKDTHDWRERAYIIKKYHHSKREANPSWTLDNTAKDLGLSKSTVYQDIRLAEAFEQDESLTKLTRQKALNHLDTVNHKGKLFIIRDTLKPVIVERIAEVLIDNQIHYILKLPKGLVYYGLEVKCITLASYKVRTPKDWEITAMEKKS